MIIRKKSKEELQDQAEWFLDYAEKTWKITEKQKERISKILWISDSEKEWFFERLSHRAWNWIYDKEEIGKKLTQGNLVHKWLKKYVWTKYNFWIYKWYDYDDLVSDMYDKWYIKNFEKLWKEYWYYLRFKKYFEKYKTPSDVVNYKFIDHLSRRFCDLDYYKERQNYNYFHFRDDPNHYRKKFLKESERYKTFRENFDILMNSWVHKQVGWIKAIEEDKDNRFFRMDAVLDCANPINLKIILDKYPNIEIETLFDYSHSSFLKCVKNENLWILFEKFPEIDVKVLFKLENKLEDSEFKTYIVKLFDFYPSVTLDEFLWVSGRISVEELLLCNNMDDFLGLICKRYSFNFDSYKTIFCHYNSLFIDKIKGNYFWETDREKLLKYGNTESIKVILNKYPNIKPENLAICLYMKPDVLKIIFEKYPEIDLETFVNSNWLHELLLNASPIILGVMLNKYKIDSQTLLSSELLHNYVKPENLEIIFEKYPEIGFKELSSLENDKVHVLSLANPNNLKVIFEKYPEIKIEELAELDHVLNYKLRTENLAIVLENFWPLDLAEINQYEKLFCFNGMLPVTLNFKEENHKWYLKFLNEIIDTNYNSDKKSEMIEKVVSLTFEQAQNYVEIFKMLDDSISMDIQRIKNELIGELLERDNPKDVVKQIINIFERNNLPLTWKIFKVFELLYPKEKFKNTLRPYWSPVLHQYLDEWKNVYNLIYKDLMNIAIKSWDRSLRDYLKTFIWSEKLLKKFEDIVSSDWFDWSDVHCLEGKLEEQEQVKLLYLFRRISVLYNRYFWGEINEWNTIEDKKYWKSIVADNQLVGFYNDIKKWFNLRDWKSIYDRLQTLVYVNWLNYHSAEEILEEMSRSKEQAHEKWLQLYNNSNWWKIEFPRQVFLKWVTEDAFSKIINRWVTCREYLWGWEDWKAAWSDATPFDIDWIYVDCPTEWTSYWNINLVVDATKSSIYDTKEKWIQWYSEDKYELFVTWWWNHYWIRTGIPMTEVDYIIYYGDFSKKEFEYMCYEIARNGYYIPITDKEWYIKFTPEMYHNIRKWFNYMKYYDGFDVELKDWKYVSKESDNEVHKDSIDGELWMLILENSPSNERYKEFAKENRELAENTIEWIKRILEEKCWIQFNSEYDGSITWAQLYDSWSTWRWTDIPTKDVDLDFTLLLDAKDYERVDEIGKIIHEEIWTQKNDDHWVVEWWNQIKSKINNIWKSEDRPNWVPLDLLILKKSQVIDYSSSDAMREKLNYIASNQKTWAEDLDWVRTNVIIMKKLLKAKWCYKHPEWWIAWIWVENWITQNHWSFVEALESFEKVAYWGEYKEWMDPISLDEFQALYPMYDAWENYKDWCNDNFVYKLKENGYRWTLDIIKIYRLEWIEWIRKVIKEYEVKKANFIE